MTSGPIPLCTSCAHRTHGIFEDGPTCAAFPGGIPDAIFIGGFDHREPFPEDHGIRWRFQPGTPGFFEAWNTATRAGQDTPPADSLRFNS